MKKAASCTTFIVPPMCPEISYFCEIWSSREAHAAHKQTPHFLRWNVLASRESTFWKNIS
jgi:quinol monooxygenase YgiN